MSGQRRAYVAESERATAPVGAHECERPPPRTVVLLAMRGMAPQRRPRGCLMPKAHQTTMGIGLTWRSRGIMWAVRLPTPTLHTARLRLHPFTSQDGDALFTLHTNAAVLRYWDAPAWTGRERAERFVATCRQMAEEGSGGATGRRPLPRRRVHRMVLSEQLESELPQRIAGLLLPGGLLGARLRNRERHRAAPVGL